MFSFAVFTLTISYIVKIIPFDPNSLRLFAVFIIGFLGVVLLVPKLSQILEGWVSRFSGKLGSTNQNRNGFVGGFITGAALGIVWTPCAGPILATIATLAATTAVNFQIVLVTIVYVIGVGIPLFLFSLLGRTLITKSRFLSSYTGRIQQVFGLVMILTAVLIYTNYDKVLQAKLLDAIPSYSQFLTDLENNSQVTSELKRLKNSNSSVQLENEGDAPNFVGIAHWLNSKPLTMEQLRGKVVLVDFWTYTCINCIRTLPHIVSWNQKYKDKGLVIVGVHTPEFEFEKSTQNVENALKQYGITYPVAQDNDFATWNAYNNHYWPAKYLIDKNGKIRYHHFGEGKYEETERVIQELLKETGATVSSKLTSMPDKTPQNQRTPELYLGSSRMQYYFPSVLGSVSNGSYNLTLPEDVPESRFSLGGDWTVSNEYSESGKNAVLVLHFTSQKVFLVMKPSSSVGKVKVLLDGKEVGKGTEGSAGADVKNGIVNVDTDRLYELIHLPESGNHILRLEFLTPGIQVFAFTFG